MNAIRHVCNYALLRYLPYPETGEFVNVGVVAHCAEPRWFGYEIPEENRERVIHFFPDVNDDIYDRQMSAMEQELNRMAELLKKTTDRQLGSNIFQELIRHRESVLRFGEVRTALTHDPEALLKRLCVDSIRPRSANAKLTLT